MPGNDYKSVQNNWDRLGVPETIWVGTAATLGATGNVLGELGPSLRQLGASGSDWGLAEKDGLHTGNDWDYARGNWENWEHTGQKLEEELGATGSVLGENGITIGNDWD